MADASVDKGASRIRNERVSARAIVGPEFWWDARLGSHGRREDAACRCERLGTSEIELVIKVLHVKRRREWRNQQGKIAF